MFDKIKKQNGERFAKAIRAYDNGIFDVPNIDQIVKYAGREAEPIINYLISLKDIKIEEHGVYQTPIELLDKAGYNAYYADSLQKQNYISKYYAPGEALCTFKDRERYKNYYIINAIKKNVDEIKRENFPNPQREDEYGTSVISIQVAKQGGFISIKNRYNHTVENPDNTFNSNPDNIIEGLSESIKHHFNVDFSSQKMALPDNYIQCDKQIVNYNYEVNNTYFGERYYAKDGIVHEINPQTELMLEHFILDLHKKKLKNPCRKPDSFIDAFNEEIKGKKLQVVINEAKNKCLLADGVQILELEKGKIVSLNFPSLTKIGNNFLTWKTGLKELSLSNVKEIKNNFLPEDTELQKLSIPKVEVIGDSCLCKNRELKELSIPNGREIGARFLLENEELQKLSMPNVTEICSEFLFSNKKLKELNMPKVRIIGRDCLYNNREIKELSMPNLIKTGNGFLSSNEVLQKFLAPKLYDFGSDVLSSHPQRQHFLNPQTSLLTKLNAASGRG